MVKRELIRIAILAAAGVFVALFNIDWKNTDMYYLILMMPVYFVGMFYAGKLLLKLIGVVAKTYFSYQFMSLLINPLWGTVLCLILLCLGLIGILSFGWIIGLGRCIYCLVTAYQLDQQCRGNQNEFDYW